MANFDDDENGPPPPILEENQPDRAHSNRLVQAVPRVGGFFVGQKIKVTNKRSTYHGRPGVVSRFCKNGSHKQIYVELFGVGEKRLATHSISATEEVRDMSVEVSTGSTGASLLPDAEGSTLTAGTAGTNRTTFAKKILELSELIENVREQFREDDGDLRFKLREIQAKLLALSLYK